MKAFKRVAALVLALLMVIGLVPMSAVAATISKLEDHTYTLLWTTDPQWYSFAYQDIITHQNQWVVDNYKRLDVRYTFHTGDFVNYPNETVQWDVMDKAYKLWDDIDYPYGVLAGNHDVDGSDHSTYSKYFGESRFNHQPWYGESYEDNFGHYDLMTIDGTDFIFVYMGYNSSYTQEVYDWLNYVLAKHADRVATLCFHDYLQANGERSPNGETFFQKVVLKNPNVRMVMCGHNYNSTRKVETIDDNGDGKADRTVYQIMANYQSTTNGGNGFMRFMECDTAAGEIVCRTYSPYTENFGSDYEDGAVFDEYGTRDNFTIPFDFTAPTPKGSGDPEYGTVVNEPQIAFATTDSDGAVSLPVVYQNTVASKAAVGVYDRYFSADATDAFSDPKALDYVIARYTAGKGYAVSWVVDGDALANDEAVAIPHDGVVITIPDDTVDLSRLNLGRKIVVKNTGSITTPAALKPITLLVNGTYYSVNDTNRLNGNNEWTIYDSLGGNATRYAHTWDMLFACTPVSGTTYTVTAVDTALGKDKTMAIPTGGFVLAINTYSGGKRLAESLRRLMPTTMTVDLNGYEPGKGTTYNKQSLLPSSSSNWTLEANAATATENGVQVFYKSGGTDSGSWPSADYRYDTPIKIDPAGMTITYDYTLETSGRVNIVLYFNGTDSATSTSDTRVSLQTYFAGASLSSTSKDLLGDDVARSGKIDLSGVSFPNGCYNSDGTLSLSAIRVMNVGYVGKKLIVRDLSLATNVGVTSDADVKQTIPLVSPAITVKNEALAGGYTYNNGQLSVTANTDNGYELTIALNDQVNITNLKTWLVNLSSTATFDIRLTATTANGDMTFGLADDFGPSFADALVDGCIPAGRYSKQYDLLSCFEWNNVVPANGVTTIKTVTVRLRSAGTLNILACQLTNAGYGGYFADGVYETVTTPRNVLSSDVYTIDGAYIDDVTCGTSVQALCADLTSDYTVTVYEGGVAVNGAVTAKTGQTVVVTSGDITLATFTLVVKGDVFGVGKLNTSGMRLVLKYCMGKDTLSELQFRATDANDNDVVNTVDVRMFLVMMSK